MNPTWLSVRSAQARAPNPNYRCSVDHPISYSVLAGGRCRGATPAGARPYPGHTLSSPSRHRSAKLDLRIAGQWSGFAGPKTTGSAQLHSVQAKVRGLNEPLEITTADLTWVPPKPESRRFPPPSRHPLDRLALIPASLQFRPVLSHNLRSSRRRNCY